MSGFQEELLATITAAGGRILWQDLIDSVDYQLRQTVFQNVRALQQQGLVQRELAIDKETGKSSLTIVKVG